LTNTTLRRPRSRPAGALAFLGILAACERESAEHARLVAALDRLAEVPAEAHVERRAAALALGREPARTERGKAARDACAKAYGELNDSNELVASIHAELRRPVKPTDAQRLASETRRAEDLLERARASMDLCDAAALRLDPSRR
jgi:hypothetical protein